MCVCVSSIYKDAFLWNRSQSSLLKLLWSTTCKCRSGGQERKSITIQRSLAASSHKHMYVVYLICSTFEQEISHMRAENTLQYRVQYNTVSKATIFLFEYIMPNTTMVFYLFLLTSSNTISW